jgi:2,5-diamino-6-(ribosylamino)-4(3H)-pyrimidinone 5'-phosphate reductase
MRPRVLVNMAASLDGKIAPARKVAPLSLSRHPEDGQRMRALRARADAVLIGATNLRMDDPTLEPSKLRIVVTRTGAQVEPAAKMFDAALGGEAIVAHAATMPESKRASLQGRATLVELGTSEVDPLRLLEWLASERQCAVVLCEGGGVLNARMFAAHAVDELYLTIVPRLFGGSSAPTIVEGDGFEPDAIPDARLARCEPIGDELFLVYQFDWK